jgi:protein-tyrosine phosphatase
MVDIHSHVLWDLDDGAQTLEESIEMVKLSALAGVTDLVATPHANDQFRYDPEVVAAKLERLRQECGPLLRLHHGCDFHIMAENVQDAMEHPARYTVNGGRYLLVELPNDVISGMMRPVFQRLVEAGFRPIITHPERNVVVRQHVTHLESWVEVGCLAQITAQSYTGEFGKSAQKAAWEMTRRGLVHFVASDAHDTIQRHPKMDGARKVIAEKLGEEAAEFLFNANPKAVIEDRDLPVWERPATTRRGSWFEFWRR